MWACPIELTGDARSGANQISRRSTGYLDRGVKSGIVYLHVGFSAVTTIVVATDHLTVFQFSVDMLLSTNARAIWCSRAVVSCLLNSISFGLAFSGFNVALQRTSYH